MSPKIKDITGQGFGRLIVLGLTNRRTARRSAIWKCKCNCGNNVLVEGYLLRSGNTKSCGCLQKEKAKATGQNNIKDIRGQRFGRLITMRPMSQRRRGCIVWKCKCDCGNNVLIMGYHLIDGSIKSCGCLNDAFNFARGSQIKPEDVPFEITHIMQERRKIRKFLTG